jgi:PAS domain-containing protein
VKTVTSRRRDVQTFQNLEFLRYRQLHKVKLGYMLSHKHREMQNEEYIVFVDLGRRYVDCTAAVCDLLGYTRDEMLQKKIDDASYDSRVRKLFELYRTNKEQQGEYILQRKDRMPVPIYYTAFVFDDGCNAAIWQPIKDWREFYMAALLEPDAHKQLEKIELALAAIEQSRDTELPQHTVNDAIRVLNTLRKKRI